MCVAIYKPENVKIPSLEVLKKCWEHNPDGAGFCVENENPEYKDYKWYVKKGFMTFDDFVNAISNLPERQKNGKMLIHFRIGTCGGNTPGNTHPFPITSDINALHWTSFYSNYVLVHNGILSLNPRRKNISDTGELCLLFGEIGTRKIKESVKLIENEVYGNKICIFDNDNVIMIGEWQEVNGVKFSNKRWDAPPVRSSFYFHDINNCDDYDVFGAYLPSNNTNGKSKKQHAKSKSKNKQESKRIIAINLDNCVNIIAENICPNCGHNIAYCSDNKNDSYICKNCNTKYVAVNDNIMDIAFGLLDSLCPYCGNSYLETVKGKSGKEYAICNDCGIAFDFLGNNVDFDVAFVDINGIDNEDKKENVGK